MVCLLEKWDDCGLREKEERRKKLWMEGKRFCREEGDCPTSLRSACTGFITCKG